MLKHIIESEDQVDEGLRGFYKPSEEHEGKLLLDVDAYTDHKVREQNKALESKVDELLGEKKAEQKKRQEAEERARLEAEEKARQSGDTEALEKSWQEKYGRLESDLQTQLQEKDSALRNATVDRVTVELASEFTSPAVMMPHLRSRLDVEVKDGVAKVVVKDENGQPSALTPKELAQSFKENEAFKALVKASDASGAGGSNGEGGAPSGNNPTKTTQGKTLTTEERIAARKAARGNN